MIQVSQVDQHDAIENCLDARSGETTSDASTSDDDQSGNEDEVWDGVLPECLQRDIEMVSPVPEAKLKERALTKINTLVFWFLYFLLIWQVTCHISDNGMAWLLRFLVTWLKVLGIEVSNELLTSLVAIFPGSLHLMRKFLDLDRDDFNKFVVCPSCSKLYKYDSCLAVVNNLAHYNTWTPNELQS